MAHLNYFELFACHLYSIKGENWQTMLFDKSVANALYILFPTNVLMPAVQQKIVLGDNKLYFRHKKRHM